MSRELSVSDRERFVEYLDCIAKISESAVVNVNDDGCQCLATNIDNTLILHACYIDSYDISTTLNIPDVKKLVNVVSAITTEEINFTVDSNSLLYKGESVKFKYHLFEEGLILPPSLNLDKISKFDYDVTFTVTKEWMKQLFRGSSFATETNKIYFSVIDGNLHGELTDKARHNTDSLSINLGPVEFELEPFPINFDNMRLLSTISDEIKVSINTDIGVILFDIENNGIKLKYIISALTT